MPALKSQYGRDSSLSAISKSAHGERLALRTFARIARVITEAERASRAFDLLKSKERVSGSPPLKRTGKNQASYSAEDLDRTNRSGMRAADQIERGGSVRISESAIANVQGTDAIEAVARINRANDRLARAEAGSRGGAAGANDSGRVQQIARMGGASIGTWPNEADALRVIESGRRAMQRIADGAIVTNARANTSSSSSEGAEREYSAVAPGAGESLRRADGQIQRSSPGALGRSQNFDAYAPKNLASLMNAEQRLSGGSGIRSAQGNSRASEIERPSQTGLQRALGETRGSITINSSPTLVIHASESVPGIEQAVQAALGKHREELLDHVIREASRRERAQY